MSELAWGSAVSRLSSAAYTRAMETVAARSGAQWLAALKRVDVGAVSTWALAGGLVLYLGLDGGGYDIVVRNQVGTVLWWVALLGAAAGVLPVTRLTRLAWAALALFGAFVVWTAIASTSSLSAERSLQELSRLATYLAVLLLAITIHRDRQRAVRHTVNAIAAAVVVITVFALISRLIPGAFPSSHVTATFLAGTRDRLSWPLNYWNGLAAMIALGLPLVLSVATSTRSLLSQAAAAAALPAMALCGYLTFSRGGAIASAIAIIAFLVATPNRMPKLGTVLVAAGGGAVLVAGAIHRSAVEHGLTNHAAAVQGRQLIVAIVLVCLGAGVAQVGIGLASRHGTLPRILRIPPKTAAALAAGLVIAAVIASVTAGAPRRLSHAWQDFKHNRTTAVATPSRFGSTAGNGRYDMWRIAVKSTKGHVVRGSGAGTFQLIWQPRAPYHSYVINAHSLYVETLAELGVVGLALLAAFLALSLFAAIRLLTRLHDEARVYAAGATAALVAFMVSAVADWVWQLPVLPAAFLLITGAVVAPAGRTMWGPAALRHSGRSQSSGARHPFAIRAGIAGCAIVCLVAIGVPLATETAVRRSQSAANAGDASLALADARSATRIEPGAASAQLQLALVLELQHQHRSALQAALKATRDEPQNWSGWLVVSRLEAESGNPRASVAAYRRARFLNPTSPIFRT